MVRSYEVKIKILTEEEDKICILSKVCGIEKIEMKDFWTTLTVPNLGWQNCHLENATNAYNDFILNCIM